MLQISEQSIFKERVSRRLRFCFCLTVDMKNPQCPSVRPPHRKWNQLFKSGNALVEGFGIASLISEIPESHNSFAQLISPHLQIFATIITHFMSSHNKVSICSLRSSPTMMSVRCLPPDSVANNTSNPKTSCSTGNLADLICNHTLTTSFLWNRLGKLPRIQTDKVTVLMLTVSAELGKQSILDRTHILKKLAVCPPIRAISDHQTAIGRLRRLSEMKTRNILD
jgi:hypothetical protein